MKYTTTTLFGLLVAMAPCSDAFVQTTNPPQKTTTGLSVYHYRNGADPDPSSKSGVTPQPKKGIKPIFPSYGTPEPKAPLGNVGGDPTKHKLQPVFPSYNTPEPKAPLSNVGGETMRKKGLEQQHPAWEYEGSPAPLGSVGDDSKKKGLNKVFLDWEDRGFSADGLQRQSS
jgi:hypothetical protein